MNPRWSSCAEKCGDAVLTDDYAPVENMLAPVVRQSAREILARRYLDEAQELQASQQYGASIAKYEQAVELNPSMSIKAYNEIGMMQVSLVDLEEAAWAFTRAVTYHGEAGTEETAIEETAIGSVHMNLGLLLARMNKPQESREQLVRAVKWFRIELEEDPSEVVVWDRLGDALATLGDLKGASDAFGRAGALEPANPAYYSKLARALEFQKRYDEAIDAARREMELLQQGGQQEAAAQIRQYIEILEYKRVKQAP